MKNIQHLSKKIVFIVPYFGKLPSYFDLYLHSLAQNPEFDLLLITDDSTAFVYPRNVKTIYMTFEQLKAHIQHKFDFTISLDFSYKLCDYKPAFGYIFEDMIQEYNFWGCCDLDMILGNLGHFITDTILDTYDKIFDLGHMTLYRNTYKINRSFLLPLQGKPRAQEVFQTQGFCRFDEQYNKSINSIFDEHHIKKISMSFCADVIPNKSNFHLARYDESVHSYSFEPYIKQVFYRNNGSIFRIYTQSGSIGKEEFAYIHLQKRDMIHTINTQSKIQKFAIVPDRFVALENDMHDEKILKTYARRIYFNKQFFIFRYNILQTAYKNYGITGLIQRSFFLFFR